MTDIVERLRMEMRGERHADLAREAADEIERLQAALQRIADMCPATAELTLAHEMADNAYAALENKP